MRAARRWIARIAFAIVALVVVVAIGGFALLRGSLASLDGNAPIAGLSAPVSITRDALGTVTIDAANEADAMRALGFVHGQERAFEMDLMRRVAAGELSELCRPGGARRRPPAPAGPAACARARASGCGAGRPARRGAGLRGWRQRRARRGCACGRGRTCCCGRRPRPGGWRTARWWATRCTTTCRTPPAPANSRWRARCRGCRPPCAMLVLRDGTAGTRRCRASARGDATLPGPEAVDLRRWCRAGAAPARRKPRARGRQQQFRGVGRAHGRRPRDPRRRHAPRPARAEHLVPCAPALCRTRAPGGQRRRRRGSPCPACRA